MSAGLVRTVLSNPPLLICDTDATAQLLIAGNVSVLRELKRAYGIQPAIVEAVEFELRSPQSFTLRRLLQRYEPALDKALGNGTVQILDERSLPAYVGATANAVWSQIAIRATKWAFRVQRGEAYSHSAAVTLQVPLLTHDLKAITILEKDGEKLSTHLLRLFDLYAFGLQCGCMDEKECDDCRQALVKEQEYVPKAFQRKSFRDGLDHFYPRIQSAHVAPLGCPTPIDPLDSRLTLTRT